MSDLRIAAILAALLALCPVPAVADPPPVECSSPDDWPLAIVGSFEATSQGGGVLIEWETLSERWTLSFSPVRSLSPDGPFDSVSGSISPTGTDSTGSSYSVFDPTGTRDHFYLLMETDSRVGELPTAGVISVDEVPGAVDLGDTLVVAGLNPNYPDNQILTVPDALIICPATLVEIMTPLAEHWNTFRHHLTTIVTLEEIGGTKESIRSWILQGTENYVLLVGDASLQYPLENIIPTWELYDSELDEMLTTDAPYGDRDGDGLSDVALGRWPVRSFAEATICVQKSIEYDYQAPGQAWRQTWRAFIADGTTPGGSGTTASILSDFLFASPPLWTDVVQHRFTESLTECVPQYCHDYRLDFAISALNAGSHLVLGFGTQATPWSFVKFLDLYQGYGLLSRLSRNHKYAFFLGLSCGLGNFKDDNTGGLAGIVRPLAESFLTLRDKGAIAWFGPTGNSFQMENYGIGLRILSRMSPDGTTSLGQICSDAVRDFAADSDPTTWTRASCYSFIGDPTLVMAWDRLPTDISTESSGINLRLRADRNPSRTSAKFSVQVPVAGKVQLSVYNVAGQLVRQLVSDGLVGGAWQHLEWDGRDSSGRIASAGIYVARLKAGERAVTTKFVLLR